jgi:hypothetical protein
MSAADVRYLVQLWFLFVHLEILQILRNFQERNTDIPLSDHSVSLKEKPNPKRLRDWPMNVQWLLCEPQNLTLKNSTLCPHNIFMCFVWNWEQTAIVSPCRIKWLVLYARWGEFISRNELNI